MVDLAMGRPEGRDRALTVKDPRSSARHSMRPLLRVEGILARWFADFVPSPAVQFLRGPATDLTIHADPRVTIGKRGFGRPIDIQLDAELVLSDYMTIPLESRRDLAEAVRLRIESETPFSPSELLVSVTLETGARDQQELRLLIDMIPLAILDAGLRTSGLPARRIRSISVDQPSRDGRAIRFPTRSRLTAALRAFLLAMPLLLLGTLGIASLVAAADRIAIQADASETAGAALLKEVKGLEAQLEARNGAMTARQAYEELFDASPSSFLLLNDFKRSIPAGLGVTKFDIANGVLTVSVRTTDVLATVAEMNRRVGWKAEVSGSITTDPATRLQSADIALRITP